MGEKPDSTVTIDRLNHELVTITGSFCIMLLALDADSKVTRAAIFVFGLLAARAIIYKIIAWFTKEGGTPGSA